jgi:hypothetical protein
MEIFIKNFQPHYNSAFGKVIKNERQYKEEMKRGNYIPYEEAQQRTAALVEERSRFQVSEDAIDWMRDVKSKADRKGNVRLSDRQIQAMKDRGTMTNRENPVLKAAQSEMDSRLPEYYRNK